MAKQSPKQGNPAKKNKEQDIVSKQKDAAEKKAVNDKKAVDKKSDVAKKPANKAMVSTNKSDKDQKKTAKSGKQAPKKDSIFKKITTYFKNVRQEIKRTTWPSRDEVIRMSLIVVGALIFFGVFIFLIDQAMTHLINLYSNLDPSAVPTDGTIPADTTGTGTETPIDTTGTDTTGDTTGDVTTDTSTDPASDATTGDAE